MNSIFLELIFNTNDLALAGIESRDEIEEPLDESLSDAGLGAVTGGGSGSTVAIIDVEIEDENKLDNAISLIRQVLQSLQVPPSTIIKRSRPSKMLYKVYN